MLWLPTPIVALWFSNPLVLWGLGAASLPILIHLLNRRKYREMPWAAMRFLLAAVRKNQRRVRIEQWLLLAVRTLVVLLAVLAMARPFLESLGAVALLPGQRTHWLIAVDASMSMDAAAGEASTSRFEQARTLAAEVARSVRSGDGVSLVLLADPPRAVIGAPAFQRDAILPEIQQLAITHGNLDLPACFRKIEEVLDASELPRKEVVILTDLQRSSWSPPGLASDDNLKRLLARLSERKVRSTVIDLGGAKENRAVTDLAVDPPIVTPSLPALVRATVRQFGGQAGPAVRARLVIDGRLGPEETLSLEPGQDQVVVFSHAFPDAGEHAVEVQIDPDGQKLDDRRRLVLPVRESLRVLLVDGDPRPEPLKSESGFLAVALDPGEVTTDAAASPVSPVDVETVGESQLLGRDLSGYDVIVLANVARFTRAEVNALEGFLGQGGGVVLFGGDRVVPSSYAELLHLEGKGLLPAAIGPVVGDPGRNERPFEFDPLGFRHPIVSQYGGEDPGVKASLTSVKTARYHRLTLPKGTAAQVALAFSSGDPAVIEMPRARGRVVQVATTADADWTTWPLHQSFPPVMEQIVLSAAAGRASERNVKVGQPLVRVFPLSAAGSTATITRPGGSTALTKLLPEGDMSLLRYEPTDLSGLYEARIGPPLDRETRFAANPDPAESDPAKLDALTLRAALPGWDFVHDDNWKPLSRNAGAVARRGEIHRPLLWGLLALLLTETFLAWRFGHHSTRR